MKNYLHGAILTIIQLISFGILYKILNSNYETFLLVVAVVALWSTNSDSFRLIELENKFQDFMDSIKSSDKIYKYWDDFKDKK